MLLTYTDFSRTPVSFDKPKPQKPSMASPIPDAATTRPLPAVKAAIETNFVMQ